VGHHSICRTSQQLLECSTPVCRTLVFTIRFSLCLTGVYEVGLQFTLYSVVSHIFLCLSKQEDGRTILDCDALRSVLMAYRLYRAPQELLHHNGLLRRHVLRCGLRRDQELIAV